MDMISLSSVQGVTDPVSEHVVVLAAFNLRASSRIGCARTLRPIWWHLVRLRLSGQSHGVDIGDFSSWIPKPNSART